VFWYHCVMEQLHSPESGAYTSYGIAVFEASGGRQQKLSFVSDVFLDQARAAHLAEACTAGQLAPSQLLDVVEDALAELV